MNNEKPRADLEEQIMEERQKLYGSPLRNFADTAIIWTGLLRSHYPDLDIPQLKPYMVPIMLAALKLARIAYIPGSEWADSYTDARNYVTLAEKVVASSQSAMDIEHGE